MSFNPFLPGEYSESLPLYLDNNFKSAYQQISFRGLGTYPNLYFDRREIFLPTAELNAVSQT